MIVILLISMLLIGLALFTAGLRGRRIDDHPLCRHCGFDLTGRPADTDRCAECGTFLTGLRAIRVGHRARRRGPLMVGIFILLPAIGGIGVGGVSTFRHMKFIHYEPVWWLSRKANSKDTAARDAALGELLRRMNFGTLSAHQAKALVEQSLAVQEDTRRSWTPAWGDLIESADAHYSLSNHQRERYLRQGFVTTYFLRSPMKKNEDIEIHLQLRFARVGSNLSVVVAYKGGPLRFGNIPVSGNFPMVDTSSYPATMGPGVNNGYVQGITPPRGAMAPVREGPILAALTLHISMKQLSPAARPTYQFDRELTSAVTILPGLSATTRHIER